MIGDSGRIGRPLAAALLLSAACATGGDPGAPRDAGLDAGSAMNPIAESYVRLVLAVGVHDEGYVDAYYGPPEWREEVRREAPSLETIRTQAAALLESLSALPPAAGDDAEMIALRHRFLVRQIEALHAWVGIRLGETLTFEGEAEALYDVRPPRHDEAHFRAILDQLDAILPGDGPLAARYEAFRRDFAIPPDRLDTVFQAALEEARRRVGMHLTLPDGERFRIAYVTDKPWSGYNWYQGGGESLIEINTDLPIYVDRAIDLACHEGYPGHHLYNAMLEKRLVRDRGWWEFAVYALYSPQSLIAEGSANYGIEMAFPREERLAFERDVLFPLAGISPDRAESYYTVHALVSKLNYAGNEAARRYLDGEIDAEGAAAWLTEYALMSPERARQRVRFIDTYRAYVINYNLGEDLVRRHVEAETGKGDPPATRWQVFEALLSTPRVPSGLSG